VQSFKDKNFHIVLIEFWDFYTQHWGRYFRTRKIFTSIAGIRPLIVRTIYLASIIAATMD